jgi:hypothetical protein
LVANVQNGKRLAAMGAGQNAGFDNRGYIPHQGRTTQTTKSVVTQNTNKKTEIRHVANGTIIVKLEGVENPTNQILKGLGDKLTKMFTSLGGFVPSGPVPYGPNL